MIETYTDEKVTRERVRMPSGRPCNLFFEPYPDMIKWLVKYANGRIIIDIGCGSGWLLKKLTEQGGKCIGIEPFWDIEDMQAWNMSNLGGNMIHVMPYRVEEQEKFIKALGIKAMMLFARPCHSDFVENALNMRPKGMEALYITVPKNIELYQDLGEWDDKKILLNHEGTSIDNEVVYSIKD